MVHHLAGTVTDLLLEPCSEPHLDAEMRVGIAGDALGTRSNILSSALTMDSGYIPIAECSSSIGRWQIELPTAVCIGQ